MLIERCLELFHFASQFAVLIDDFRHDVGITLSQCFALIVIVRGSEQGLDLLHSLLHIFDPFLRFGLSEIALCDLLKLTAFKQPAARGTMFIHHTLQAAQGGAGLREELPLLDFEPACGERLGIVLGLKVDEIEEHPVATQATVEAESGCCLCV